MTRLRATATSAEATVRGSAPYKVHLGVENGEPVFSCTCPVGADGNFCKHAVALALVATDPRSTQQQPDVDAEVDVRAFLEGLGHDRLVDLVLEIASADELALARLGLDAAKASSGPPPLRAFLDAIDDAFETDDYVWSEMPQVAAAVGRASRRWWKFSTMSSRGRTTQPWV